VGETGCENAPVDLQKLTVETVKATPCPYDFGARGDVTSPPNDALVRPQISWDRALDHGMNSFDELVRLAERDPTTGKTTVGPVVMTYDGEVNTYQLANAYGDGLVWIYDCDASSGPTLVEASASTGVVEARIAMPNICRPQVFANADGFFLAPSEMSAGSPGGAIYHVAPGASQATRIISVPGGIDWTATYGATLWMELSSAPAPSCRFCQTDQLVRFVGPEAMPDIVLSGIETSQQGPALSGGSLWVVEAVGRGAQAPTFRQQVVRIDIAAATAVPIGATGAVELEAGAGQPAIAYLHDRIYVLEGGAISVLPAWARAAP
jgi:hypothetical protein